ncbi:unnamed protein product [Adineta steineri]|uniref:BRCT domain-containing protein n=1 Tax=Adineta steineri TaxID=433720 RepID=A0A813SZV6_9BILA|nr:unnamed protein product [Adineta steineri]CAF3790981.1 unnamed protein product [Adineta steineri]
MTSTDDPYQFAMDESISDRSRTRSSSRNRKPTSRNVSKPNQQRIVTRSSQKTPLTPMTDENDNSFMSNIHSGFSQFVNPKKRQRDDKKTKTLKRPKITTDNDENQSPNEEIQAIDQVKLIYETNGGRTNLARAAATNAQILANRNPSNATFTLNVHNHIIDDTQIDTLAIPDTLADMNTQHNDSSWQRDIDRLMKKLEEPSTSSKLQTQIEETQKEDDDEEEEIRFGPIYISQTGKTQQRSIRTEKTQTQPILPPPPLPPAAPSTTTTTTTSVTQMNEIAIQTENSQNLSSMHACCQDVSTCPCVLRYSKLERLFMEKMSRFISIVPTIPPNPEAPIMMSDTHPKRRPIQHYPRFRRFRGRRKINHRMVIPSVHNNESTTVEETTSDETMNEIDNQAQENIDQTEVDASNITINPIENIASTTITIEKNVEPINDLSAIEKLETTTIIDHPSTLLIPSENNSCLTGRHLVLTTSSLDETQKSQFRLFTNRFNVSTSSLVDSSTTHIIVNDNSQLVCPLTGKIIQGIARHLFIVSYRWLNESLSQETIVDERPYEIRGDTSLGVDHGGMCRSRLTPSYLFTDYSICLRCSPNDCAPLQTIEQVQELIELCGAKLVRNFSEIRTLDKDRQMILVLGINGACGGEKKRKAILDTCQQFNVRCVNIHWLLISIAKFEVQPLDNYDINQV